MKALFVAALLLSAQTAAFAQAGAPDPDQPPAPNAGAASGASFDQIKQHHLNAIAKRIARLQQAQQCMNAASSIDALRACEPRGHAGQRNGAQPQ